MKCLLVNRSPYQLLVANLLPDMVIERTGGERTWQTCVVVELPLIVSSLVVVSNLGARILLVVFTTALFL